MSAASTTAERRPAPDAPSTPDTESRSAAAWRALAQVEDPELPALSIVDLGIVRFAQVRPDGVLGVGLSPTYTGCPATEHIELLVRDALETAGLSPFAITRILSPAWSSDWISPEGRRKLADYGIVPPAAAASLERRASRAPIACPRCGSTHTECTSEFGSTPCKALHRCRDCLEPFECFKCI
ncbi:MAG TPA: 1,2-phenylacetyl-CoA epoxidase subunit PaaD [Steroidobacteraceae bacterium]